MSKFSPYTRLLIVAVALGASAAGAQTTVTFTDDTFDDSNWTAEMVVNEAGSSAEFTAKQDARGVLTGHMVNTFAKYIADTLAVALLFKGWKFAAEPVKVPLSAR